MEAEARPRHGRRRGAFIALIVAVAVFYVTKWVITPTPMWEVDIPVAEGRGASFQDPIADRAGDNGSRRYAILSPEIYPHYANWFVVRSRASDDVYATHQYWFADAVGKKLVGPWDSRLRHPDFNGFLPDGRYVVIDDPRSAGHGVMWVRLFDPQSGVGSSHDIQCCPSSVKVQYKLSSDLTTLFIVRPGRPGGEQALAIDVIDVATGEKLNRLEFPERFASLRSGARYIGQSPRQEWREDWSVSRDGSKVAMIGTQNDVAVYDSKTGRQLHHFTDVGLANISHAGINGVRFSPDDRELIWLADINPCGVYIGGLRSTIDSAARNTEPPFAVVFKLSDGSRVTDDRPWDFNPVPPHRMGEIDIEGLGTSTEFPATWSLDGKYIAWQKTKGRNRMPFPFEPTTIQVQLASGEPVSDWKTWPQAPPLVPPSDWGTRRFVGFSVMQSAREFNGSFVPDTTGFVVKANSQAPVDRSLAHRFYVACGLHVRNTETILYYDWVRDDFSKVREIEVFETPVVKTAGYPPSWIGLKADLDTRIRLPAVQPGRIGLLVGPPGDITLEVWAPPRRRLYRQMHLWLALLAMPLTYFLLRRKRHPIADIAAHA